MRRFGAELAAAQAELSPADFARLVETLGIGRSKVDRFMAAARAAGRNVTELRPSAWPLLFGRYEPVPFVAGETDPVIEDVAAAAEPSAYRRRADLLSADGLASLLCALHSAAALSDHARWRLGDWLRGKDVAAAAADAARSMSVASRERGHDDPDSGMGG